MDMFADMLLFNGKVVTVDAQDAVAEAVAIKFGKILAVGSDSEVKPLAGFGTKVIDLKGRTVLPGLIDSHCHIASYSEGMQRVMGVIDASYEAGVRSIADIQAKVAEQAKRKPKGEWINVVKEDD